MVLLSGQLSALITQRASATASLWVLALGIGQVAFWPELPANAELAAWALMAILAVGILVLTTVPARRILLLPLCFLFGTCYALFANHTALAGRLPEVLHGSDHRVSLVVSSLPQLSPSVSSFTSNPKPLYGFQDARFEAEVLAGPAEFIGRRLRLSWYRLNAKTALRMTAGSQWNMTVRLKQPRGSVNPHTFDFESWLLQRGIYATGYVREKDQTPEFIAAGSGLAAVRERLRQRISGTGLDTGPFEQNGLMRALLLGDRGGVDQNTRDLLRHTGTAHLLAISGLHVGMVAGIFLFLGAVLGRGISLFRGVSPILISGVAAFIGALVYTLLSGAPLSAQRALIMTAVAILALLSRRRFSGSFAFALALALVLLLQPLAVLNAGFWLSFIAVGALLLRFQGRSAGCEDLAGVAGESRWIAKLQAGIGTAVQSQGAILIALLLPSIAIFSGVSVTGLLLNLVAIPWVGMVILPLILLGASAPDPVASLSLQAADANLGWLLDFLAYSDTVLPGWQSIPLQPTAAMLLAVGTCSAVLFLPRGVPGRALGWCLVPVLLSGLTPWQRAQEPAFTLTVLDVGQGLAVVAATETHSMVFDAGPSTGSGWNAGAHIVAPFVLNTSGQTLDLLSVSHGDLDHSGGVSGVLEQLNVAAMVAPGQLEQRIGGKGQELQTSPCVAGRKLALGELTVEWLWPRSEDLSGEENDHSCVALLRWREVRILLTGDISAKAEHQIAAENPDSRPVDLLVAPHHGSRTSSSQALIQWAAPQRVVFSAGYRHHFGHPHPSVVSRYRDFGTQVFTTADLGAVQVSWEDDTTTTRIACARQSGKFWLAEGTLPSCD